MYRLTLRPLPCSEVDSLIGLRRLMKRCLRGYGLQCVFIEELADGVDPEIRNLQRIIQSLAARVAGQAETLARLAELAKVRS